MLPAKPKQAKAKPGGNQCLTQLSLRSIAQQAATKAKARPAEQRQAAEDSSSQYFECKDYVLEDLIVSKDHVQEVV